MGRVGKPRATIREVAVHAGVSRQTVSNALNAPERLTSETLARVRASIAALEYQPYEAARSLSLRRSRLLGIRIGQQEHNPAANPDPLLRMLVRTAKSSGYRFLIFETDPDDEEEIAAYDELSAQHAVDGFVVTDSHVGDRRTDWLLSRGIPFAVLGTPWGREGATHAWVDVDGAAGISRAVEHLVAQGHARIAYLGWPADGAGGDARRRGWQQAMAARGLQSDAVGTAAADDIEPGFATCRELVREHRPTAIVCASDILASAAVMAVLDAGQVPGEEVAVTGFDDSAIAQLARPRLTSLRQPLARVSEFLVREVLAQVDEPARSGAAPHLVVEPELVVRESSASPLRGVSG